jgi:hypothetical protein
MKKQLSGYYRPTPEEFEYLWANSLIILDTNCLFIPYRSKPQTCVSFFHTLEKLSDRLWLPHQVVFEYGENRLNVIADQKRAYQKLISLLSANETKISGTISSDYSRHPFIDTIKIEEHLTHAFTEIKKQIIEIEKEHPDLDSDDPFLKKTLELFNGKVGPEYTPKRLHEIYIEGKSRYESDTPPGYEDKDKTTDRELYGDLIIWFQIIDHAKLTKKSIIFITGDNKEDWWWILKGKTIGPKPELVKEIKEKANVSFYMYNLDRFLQFAQEYLHEKVDQTAIAEIRNIRMEASIEEAKRDKEVRIEANKDSFVIGKSVSFAGYSFTGDSIVRLIVFGPGKYSEGLEIATPPVSKSHNWLYTWNPGFDLDPGHYTMIVYDSKKQVSDEITVTAHKGSIAIVVKGNQSYFIGEEIKISGTSTVSYFVYLMIVGPEPSQDVRKLDTFSHSKNGDENSFVRVGVMDDNTWSYIWDTSKCGTLIKSGIYRIFASQNPFTPDNIKDSVFGSVSIILKKPFVSATVALPSFARGDPVYISGTGEGTPRQKLQVWIFGESFYYHDIIRVNSDASFLIKLPPAITKNLQEGKYFGVIQHPMMNNEFDVFVDCDNKKVMMKLPTESTHIFSLEGPHVLRGEKAFIELIASINSPDIDDTYTQFTFIIEKPFIKIDPISTKHVGDKFTITARTNLLVDDEIMVALFPSINTSEKKNVNQFSGATGTIKVVRGEFGSNKIAFDIDTSNFQPGEYAVRLSVMLNECIGETKFRLH